MRLLPAFATVLVLAAAPVSTPAAAQIASSSTYPLGQNDLIELSIFGPTDKVIRTRVKADGSVTLPFIGTMQAAGLTTSTLGEAVAAKLKRGGVFQQPIVNVEIIEYVSRAVTVLGQVGTPGIYPLDRSTTLASMLARAGGVRSVGGSDAVSLRRNNNITRIPVAALAEDGNRDMPLLPGDVVYVADADRFYIYGQVNAPGAYEIAPGMTLRQALARGGGPTLAGTEKRVSLYRGGRQEKNMELDERMRPGDVLTVGERTF